MKKKVLFYCQHILGMGHFIRSMEIVRGLKNFDVYFLNGGEILNGFELPPSVEVVNLPPIRSDSEFQDIQVVDSDKGLAYIKEARKNLILRKFAQVLPDLLVIELFPFGRKKFSFELIPLLERVRSILPSTKVVCSLRDILVSKQDQARYEERVCDLVNRYFDLLLIHSDPRLQRLEETFSRVQDIRCEVRYTGFVAQRPQKDSMAFTDDAFPSSTGEPLILVSIGGGRVGYELVECAIKASSTLEKVEPHRMLIFCGPYMPAEQFMQLQARSEKRPNISLRQYTNQFLAYMEKADLSISMAGYNTCMNILMTGVKALVLPFTGENDDEQTIRTRKLERLGVVTMIHPEELHPDSLANKILLSLESRPVTLDSPLDTQGVEKTSAYLTDILNG